MAGVKMFVPSSKGRGFALAAGLLGCCALAALPARAADDGYANVFSSVLGSVGLIKADPPPDIEYRERPPLVLPREATLPKPQAGGSRRTAAWPQDPDVLRKRRESEEAHAPHTLDPTLADKSRTMSPDEAMAGRAASDEPVRPNTCGNDGQRCLLLSPDELKAQSDAFKAANPDKADTVVAGQEPAREFLTQPPKGYMKSTKAVKATAEAPEEKMDESSPRYMRQQELKHQQEQLQ